MLETDRANLVGDLSAAAEEALRDTSGVLRGASAWKTRGAPLRQYLEDRPDD